ncbi:MAG TPA: GMC oxidoreductase [Solirubrobacteraceae bacterium]|jgi:hypothetical protein|nr:GMC oxidoreductase [Solirubrobacteraceae bacterium]
MAVAVGLLNDTRRQTLEAVCDTFAPSIEVDDGGQVLRDTKGVWIGDGSAFPTAPGVNPMISIISLAHRTAANMLAA